MGDTGRGGQNTGGLDFSLKADQMWETALPRQIICASLHGSPGLGGSSAWRDELGRSLGGHLKDREPLL